MASRVNGRATHVHQEPAGQPSRRALPSRLPRPEDAARALSDDRFFDLAVDMLCVTSTDGYFKRLNPAWQYALGWSTQELLARPFIAFIHRDDREATLREAALIRDGSPSTLFRNRFRCRDGSYRWLSWTATSTLADGLIYAGARDVTDAVLEEEQRREQLNATIARIREAIDGNTFDVAWQPIVELRGHGVKGFEALSRFRARPLRGPLHWFAEADRVGLRIDLELQAIKHAMDLMPHLPHGSFLALNVSPMTLLSDELADQISAADSRRLVLEVTEHAVVDDYPRLARALQELRSLGVRLAIDDAGAGFASFSHILRLHPDFIKLDGFLIDEIDVDPAKRALACALLGFATDIGAQLVAEGVETTSQLRVIEDLGIHFGQGYRLGVPAPLSGLAA